MVKNKLGVIFAIVFVDFLGLSFILPLYPELASNFGLSATMITLLAASYAAMQFVFSPILGRLSDKIGRKPVLLMSTLGTAVSFVIFGLAGSTWVLFGSRILSGIFGANTAVAQAYITDSTKHHERTEGMGLVGAALGLGLIFGPALSGFLGKYGFSAPALAAAGVTLINAILITFLLKESLPKQERSKSKTKVFNFSFKQFKTELKKPLMGSILITYFLTMFALAAIQNIAILFAQDRFHLSIEESGYFFAFVGAILVLVQGVIIGRAAKIHGESKLIIWGIIMMSLGYFLAPTALQVWTIVLFAGLIAVGAGLYLPAINSLISKKASAEERGEVFGINQAMVGLALILGPVFGGVLFDTFGSGSPFFVAAFITLISLAYAFRIYRRVHHAEKRSLSNLA